jgi:endo-1,4-beta-D-glucanase Y
MRSKRRRILRVELLECRLPLSNAFPFPQHAVYASGTIAPNHRSQVQLDDDVRAFYDEWRDDYIVAAGTNNAGTPLYRVSFGSTDPERTVSEGQGYGMMITATMAGHDPNAHLIFDGLWEFSREHTSDNDNRLMSWQVPEVVGLDSSAFDGDVDIAYGLLLADQQWGSLGDVDYNAAAQEVMDAVMDSTIGPVSRLPMLGDWVDPNGANYNQYTTRTSDLIPGHFRSFASAANNPVWHDVATNARAVVTSVQANHSQSTGLLPDFVVPLSLGDTSPQPAGASFLEGPFDGDFYYNAGRDPWRIATDALLNDDADSLLQSQKISEWAETETAGQILDLKAGYDLDGTPLPNSDYFTSFFAAPLGVAAMTNPSQQVWLNSIYDEVFARHEDYYEDSVTLMSLLVMTQNFWDPSNPTGRGQPKSLFIGIDGLRPDGLEAADTPFLDSLIDGTFAQGAHRGAYTPFARNEDITVSGPNHSTILTGVHRDKHMVTNNSFSGGDFANYPGYLSRLESALPDLNTVRLMTWSFGHTAIPTDADFSDQDTDVGNAQSTADIFSGTHSLYQEDADSVYLFLDDVDLAGHGFGYWPNEPQYLSKVEEIDDLVGVVLTSIASRPDFAREDWLIVVSTDHGGTRGGSHGNDTPEERTIPFIVSGRNVTQGDLSEDTKLVDVAPTILSHMGLTVPAEFDGHVVGKTVLPAPDLLDELVVYLPFDDDYTDQSRSSHVNDATAAGGTPALLTGGGKFGGYVEFNGGGDYLTLGTPADLDFGTATDFTITMWVRRASDQVGDSVLISNKNWASGANQGWVLAYDNAGGGYNDIQANIGDGVRRSDVDPSNADVLDTNANWQFVAVTVDRDQQMRVLTDGGPNNSFLNFLGITGGENPLSSIADVGTPNSMATNIGQDGTGVYNLELLSDIDDLAIWRRALSYGEINLLFNGGQGTPLSQFITIAGPPQVNSVSINLPFVDPADLPSKGPQPTSWENQRSDLRSITVAFTEPVLVGPDDLVLTNLGVDAPTDADVNIPITAEQIDIQGSAVTISFETDGLTEGVYSLQLLSSVTDLDGIELDGNGDSIEGDAFLFVGDSDNRFYELAADFNGDQGISVFDFTTFSYWFGTSTTDGTAPAYADLNGDHGVSVFDFSVFSNNFARSVNFPVTFAAIRLNDESDEENTDLFAEADLLLQHDEEDLWFWGAVVARER